MSVEARGTIVIRQDAVGQGENGVEVARDLLLPSQKHGEVAAVAETDRIQCSAKAAVIGSPTSRAYRCMTEIAKTARFLPCGMSRLASQMSRSSVTADRGC